MKRGLIIKGRIRRVFSKKNIFPVFTKRVFKYLKISPLQPKLFVLNRKVHHIYCFCLLPMYDALLHKEGISLSSLHKKLH